MSAAPDPAPAAHDDGAVTTAASGAGGATAAPEPVVSSGMSLDKAKLAALLTRRGLGSLVSVTPASEGVVNGVFFVEARGATSDATPGGEGGGGVTGQGGHDAAVVSYVLRLTSSHMFGKPRDAARKTANEISVMQFLAAHTSVPVPRIVAHSSSSSTGGSEELELGHHFMLMEHGGKPLSAVLKAERAATASDAATTDAADERKAGDGVKSAKDDGLTSSRERAYMDHLAEIIAELRRVKFDTCGCFTSLSAGQLQLGPWVQFMGGPSKRTCDFYAAMITSHLDDLEAVRTFAPFVPRLRDFVGRVLPEQCAPYDGDPFVLTHYDLQGNNILVSGDPDSEPRIASIIDWEWCGAYPRDEEHVALARGDGTMFLPPGVADYLHSRLAALGVAPGDGVAGLKPVRDLCASVFAANCYKAWGIPAEAQPGFVAQKAAELDTALSSFGC